MTSRPFVCASRRMGFGFVNRFAARYCGNGNGRRKWNV